MNRIKLWNTWRKYSTNGPLYKLAVLFGFVKSPTFERLVIFEDPFMTGIAMARRKNVDERYKALEIKFIDPGAQKQYADYVYGRMNKEKKV